MVGYLEIVLKFSRGKKKLRGERWRMAECWKLKLDYVRITVFMCENFHIKITHNNNKKTPPLSMLSGKGGKEIFTNIIPSY